MTLYIPPIPEGDPPDTRAKGEPWHIGCMITQERAAHVAAALFPECKSEGTDCHNERGREGEPCRLCAERNEGWSKRVRCVRRAMLDAFRMEGRQ
jgi:hypothetical protein